MRGDGIASFASASHCAGHATLTLLGENNACAGTIHKSCGELEPSSFGHVSARLPVLLEEGKLPSTKVFQIHFIEC